MDDKIINEIRHNVKELLEDSKGSHDWDHTQRVYNLAVRLAEVENADMNIVKLAAILHDISRKEEDHSKGKIDHSVAGVQKAGVMLELTGVDSQTISSVQHCIETHRFRNEKLPETIEAKVLFDADKLDSIGAVGIGRAFLFAGEIGAKLHNKGVDIDKTKPYTEDDTAYREYMVKLSKVKDRMLTDEGKRLAAERHYYMVGFFNRLDKEVTGEL